MPGRRWSDGLHQAVEAKEGVKIKRENQTLATITFQNYFRMYEKLVRHDRHGRHRSGRVRQDLQARRDRDPDQPADDPHRGTRPRLPHRDARSSTAIVEEINELQQKRPARCWSARSRVEKSEKLVASCSRRSGIKHDVLNAKYHAHEAEIVAQAGRKGAVTIATNMAGRGTDILLGGNPEYMARQQSPGRRRRPDARARRRALRRRRRVRLLLARRELSRAAARLGAHLHATSRRRRDAEHDEVIAAGRPAHPRHRAPRSAPHRQPAARPRRPSGRPGLARASTCRSKTT